MDLNELRRWDGKSAAVLKDFYAANHPDIAELVAVLDDAGLSAPASWLIKHAGELGRLGAKDAQLVLDALRSDADWATVLHLVQAIDRLDVAELDCTHALSGLRKTIHHDAPFVRAWSISAFAKIAATQDELMPEAKGIVMAALMRDEKPSVKARLKRAAAYLDQS